MSEDKKCSTCGHTIPADQEKCDHMKCGKDPETFTPERKNGW